MASLKKRGGLLGLITDEWIVQRDDGSGYRSFSNEEAAENYYNLLQALDYQKDSIHNQEETIHNQEETIRNQKESLDFQKKDAANRTEMLRNQMDLQKSKLRMQSEMLRLKGEEVKSILTRQDAEVKICAVCKRAIPDDSLFCPFCGKPRERCSRPGCGGFIDAGMGYCSKCGKPTPAEEKRLAEEKRRQEEARIAEEMRRIEEKRRQEEARMAALRRLEEEKLRLEEARKREEQRKREEREMLDPNNYIDKGDYIELKKPIGNIRMIQKDWVKQKVWLFTKECFNWSAAIDVSQELTVGGFSDWRIPTKEELKIIYKIKDFCGITKSNMFFWSFSSTYNGDKEAWIVGFSNGTVCSGSKVKGEYCIRCVR